MSDRAPHEITITLRRPLTALEIPDLCDDAAIVLALAPAARLVCDVAAIVSPDRPSLDALARLALVARRVDTEVELVNACPSLVAIVDMAGLADVIRVRPVSGVEVGREPEQGEEGVGVEEEVELDDLAP